ncbi:MAG TPA: DUF748 domain-containing protein [Tepidisphaeraceae bacterium]
MVDDDDKPAEPREADNTPDKPDTAEDKRPPRRWGRRALVTLLVLVILLIAARVAMPTLVRWYVVRVIDRSPLYEGKIADIDVHLWRGAYTIRELRLSKTTGSVPVPLFSAERVDLALEWNALLSGKLVGRMILDRPELNFVDSQKSSEAQTGAGGPWLEIIRDLFPFKINSARFHDGAMHFRAFDTRPPVDIYLSQLDGSIENLTNIHDETAPLIATVSTRGMAMDQAKFEYEMKLDPFSYRPTFQLAVRLLGLDVTKLNALARAYGSFDFQGGWFDLVIEAQAQEGSIEGYVKPLFRNLKVFDPGKDLPPKKDIVETFWEALVGVTTGVFRNAPRDQFGTLIHFRGDLRDPHTNLLEIVGNVLRNAFIRAYLPRLRGAAPDISALQFDPGQISDPLSPAQK